MNEEQRIKVLEEELKILKNELKTVLLDLREQYLNIQNPFNYSMAANTSNAQPGASPEPETKSENRKNNNNSKKEEEGKKENDMSIFSQDEELNEPVMDLSIPEDSPSIGFDNDMIDNQFASPGFQLAEAEPATMPGPSIDDDLPGSRPGITTYFENNDSDEESEPFITEPQPAINKNSKKKEINLPSSSTKFDLVVIAGLTQWVDQATAKLGKERTEALVEMSCTMGRTPEHLKEVLIKMARLSPHESNGQPLKASDYLSILAQLENLLGNSEIKDHALLSILSMMKESNNG